ncbi:MAG: response regulator [Sedimentisphaerales bacterium]|nr:response regulator [Sedimentisphaerales bacterium]
MAESCSKVLVIEDEEHIRTVIEYNLKQQGFEVYRAGDGVVGLELARRVLPDVILLDWMMPEMDGLEILTELKYDNATAQIPVLMLTARGTPSDIEKALELGANGYITKPFDPTSLGRTIREKLRKQTETVPTRCNEATPSNASETGQRH